MVEQLTALFEKSDKMVLGIAPEGTRSAATQWKSGFALLATAADVPVLPAILDYRRRVVTFAPLLEGLTDPDEIVRLVQAAAAEGVRRSQV